MTKRYPNIIRLPDTVILHTDTYTKAIAAGESMLCNDVTINAEVIDHAMRVTVCGDQTPIRYVTFGWRVSLPSEDTFVLGDAWERSYGDLAWSAIEDTKVIPWYFLMSDRSTTAGYGVKTNPSALCSWEIMKDWIYLYMDLRCGTMGVTLSGRSVEAAVVVQYEWAACTPFEAAQGFCRIMCDNGILPAIPVYGSNNWYYAYGESCHGDILEEAKWLSMRTKGLKNRPYLVIDDGWQRVEASAEEGGGTWLHGNEKFPDMARLASEIKALDIHPGLWYRPLLNIDRNMPDSWKFTREPSVWDPSHPEVLAYIAEDIRRFAQWGYELVKYDFTSWDIFGKWGFQMTPDMTESGWTFYDRSKTTAEIIMGIYRTIFENAGDMIILGCNCVGHLGTGFMQVNRTGDDTSGKEWERTKKMGVNTLAFRLPQDGIFYSVDADCAGVTDAVPWDKNRQWIKLLAISGTPLFISVKPWSLDTAVEEEIESAYRDASEQNIHYIPQDWFDSITPSEWTFAGENVSFEW